MSRRALILDRASVPKYIKEIACRMRPLREYAYYYRLYSKCSCGGEIGFQNDINRLLKWAKSWYAIANVVKTDFWFEKYGSLNTAYAVGHHNSVVLEISDPVALRFERDDFYKDEVTFDYRNRVYVWAKQSAIEKENKND